MRTKPFARFSVVCPVDPRGSTRRSYIQAMYNAGSSGLFRRAVLPSVPVPGALRKWHAVRADGADQPAGDDPSGDGRSRRWQQADWATEYGEPTSVRSNATQASFISNFMNSWSSVKYTGPMFIYTTRDRNTGSTSDQDTLGVFQTDWTPKPAANIIAQWTATHPQTAIDPPAPTAAPSPMMALTALERQHQNPCRPDDVDNKGCLQRQHVGGDVWRDGHAGCRGGSARHGHPGNARDSATPTTATETPKALAPNASVASTDTAALPSGHQREATEQDEGDVGSDKLRPEEHRAEVAPGPRNPVRTTGSQIGSTGAARRAPLLDGRAFGGAMARVTNGHVDHGRWWTAGVRRGCARRRRGAVRRRDVAGLG
ncbi:hypothetical protein MAUB1S_04208 [Mycolicibacterium aubagnense]